MPLFIWEVEINFPISLKGDLDVLLRCSKNSVSAIEIKLPWSNFFLKIIAKIMQCF